jgi:hypothetical protein
MAFTTKTDPREIYNKLSEEEKKAAGSYEEWLVTYEAKETEFGPQNETDPFLVRGTDVEEVSGTNVVNNSVGVLDTAIEDPLKNIPTKLDVYKNIEKQLKHIALKRGELEEKLSNFARNNVEQSEIGEYINKGLADFDSSHANEINLFVLHPFDDSLYRS